MRNPVLIIIFLLTVTPIRAQQMISVIDTDTREPVPYAAFTQNGERLQEVVVIGDSANIKNKKKFDLPDNILLEYDLKDAYNNMGVKIPISSIQKLIGYKPKSERRRNRVKKNLEAYGEK